ncbi:unnamed protein product, partial [Laminaria digitata]
ASLRRKGSGFLRVAIESWPEANLRPTLSPIMRQMRDALFDTDATVRREGRHTFGVFIRLWPSEGGGMYHALDRANQRAVLQEQPHVSNFISSKASAADRGATASATSTTGAIGTKGATGGAASGLSATAAIANAATRVAMGGVLAGGGGGGGQRPPGVTRAHHLSLRQLEIEKAKRRLNQKRKQLRDERQDASAATAAAAAAAAAAAVASPIASPRLRPIVFFSSPRGGGRGSGAPGSASRAVAPSFFASPRGGRVAAPGSASRAVGSSSKVFFPSPRNNTAPGNSASPRALASSFGSSNGLRRAAQLALSKNDLMSPTLKRLLQEPSQLQRGAVNVPGRGGVGVDVSSPLVASPGSDESGLGDGGGGDSSGSGGDNGSGGRLTPAELRRSMGDYGDFETSPFSCTRSVGGGRGGGGGGDGGFVSSCSDSSSSSDDEDEGEKEAEREMRGKAGEGEKTDCSLPTRVLFAHEQSPREATKTLPVRTPNSPATAGAATTTAAAAAAASAGQKPSAVYPTLEMKCPPPREPIKNASSLPAAAAASVATAQSSSSSCRTDTASKNGGLTPRKRGGILAGGVGKGGGGGGGGGGGLAASSTVKRRVRFTMEERGGGPLSTASLNSPCRSTGGGVGLPLCGGWWGKTRGGSGVAGSYDGFSVGDGSGEVPRYSWGCRLLSLFVWALVVVAVAVVGAAAFVDRQDSSNGGSLEGLRTSPLSSPVLPPPLEELVAARHVPPTTSSVTSSDAGERAEEREEEEEGGGVVGVSSSREGDNASAEGSKSEEQEEEKEKMERQEEEEEEQEMKEEEVKEEGEEEEEGVKKEGEEEEGACASELSATDSLHDEAGVTSTPSTDTVGLPGSANPSDAGAAAAALKAEARSGAGATRAPSSKQRGRIESRATAPSEWGLLEAGAAVFGALALLATVIIKSRSHEDGGEDSMEGLWGEGAGGGGEMSTPTGKGGAGAGGGEDEFGSYSTVEMVKRGGTPATLRSVKRSRRISSSQVT